MKTFALAISAALAAGALQAQEAPAVAQAQDTWYVAGQGAIEEMLALQPNTGRALNVILFVGDGNGVGTNFATRLWMGQQAGGMGEEFVLPYETFPYAGLVKTYATNAQTPDSAPTATALNSGIKTKNDVINVPDTVAVDDCAAGLATSVTTLADIAAEMGKSVGIVTTTRITHATPAAVYARTVNRDWENDSEVPEGCAQPDIAAQLVTGMEAGVIDLAFGGGRSQFLPADVTDEEGEAGLRADGRNLVEEVGAMGGAYAWDQATFEALPAAAQGPVLGLFEPSHMLYEADREGEPSLAEMTRAAIERLQANDQGFYLMVEGGRIDHANHGTNVYRTVTDGAAFAEAVQVAMDMTDEADTLIVVTADHEHAIAFNGYCGRGTDVTGLCMGIDPAGVENTGKPELAMDGKPYSVANYINGSASVVTEQPDGTWSGTRPELTQEQATSPDYLQQALIPLDSETHSGEDVAVYARGPWAHLLTGTMEQNVIFHAMRYAVAPEATSAAADTVEGTEAAGAEAGSQGTSGDTIEEEANDAVEGLPDDATAEPLENAAEEADTTAAP